MTAPESTLSSDQVFVKTALTAWDGWLGRATKFFDSLSDEQMFQEIAPGKNRPVYLFGHLLFVHDAMIPQLGLGSGNYADLKEAFLTQPDRSVAELPTVAQLRQNWQDMNGRLATLFGELTPAQWLEPHASVSAEDF